MLKPDVARQQLEKLRSKKHFDARLNRLRKLPSKQSAIVLPLFDDSAPVYRNLNWAERQQRKKAAAAALSADSKLRGRTLNALFPTIHGEVEAGWQLLHRLPYTAGYNRRGFRAPGRIDAYHLKAQHYLEGIFDLVEQLPDDLLAPDWLAQWAAHLSYRADQIGYMFAALIDQGGAAGDTVFAILKDSAANRHEIGGPGGHATRGLLCCSRPEAWDFMVSLLLAAQRQEGLRQTILEAVDEAHPEAFIRMVGVVLEQNLIRFASVARAAGVWLGETLMVEDPKKLKGALETVKSLLGDSAARKQAVAKGDTSVAYRGLWAVAFNDAPEAIRAAKPLFADKDAGRRFAAAKLVIETGLPEAAPLVLPLLKDTDPRLVSLAVNYAAQIAKIDEDDPSFATPPKDLFERLEKVIPTLPDQPKELKAPVEGWLVPPLSQEAAADSLIHCIGDRKPERLLPYLPMMSQYNRVAALAKLCEPRTWTTKVRQTLLAIAGEPNRYVREAAIKYLRLSKLAEDEVQTLEGYLTRKTADFRRSIFELLLNRNDRLVIGTIDRLLDAGEANSRAAGIEISRRMVDGDRSAEVIRERLRTYCDEKGKRLVASEAQAIEIILNPALKPPVLDDGLGTFDPADRSPIVEPKTHKVKFATPASVAFLKELDELIHENRDKTYVDVRYRNNTEEKVLGSVRYYWEFPTPDVKNTVADDRKNLPLLELWETWWSRRSAATRDSDGFELIRAAMTPRLEVREGEEGKLADDEQPKDAARAAALKVLLPFGPVAVRYEAIIRPLLLWLVRLYPPAGAADFVLDAAETALSLVPESMLNKLPRTERDEAPAEDTNDGETFEDWRKETPFIRWLEHLAQIDGSPEFTPDHATRRFRLHRWLDEPAEGARRSRPDLNVVLSAYVAGSATLADFLDHLIGPRPKERWGRQDFATLRMHTGLAKKDESLIDQRPELRAAVDQVVNRIVEIELARGETPTAATSPAQSVNRIVGIDTLLNLIAALGKHGFTKPPSYGQGENKPAVLTRLIQVSEPLPGETPAVFAAAVNAAAKAGRFEIDRVAELGLVNPRWASHVAATIKWPGYEEAVYWFIAHTNTSWTRTLGTSDTDGDDPSKKPENAWQTIVKSRTNLSAEQRADGLIDVAWFHQAYAAVGSDKRWDAIEAAAKFLGFGQSHKKAARLADVLLGRTKKKDLVNEIRTKTLKESVRLLGLLPLPENPDKKDAELADRYKVLKEYERYARGLSALSKEPAMQAVRLGMENLAVTAGFPDPTRLEWAVTAKEVDDLGKGPVKLAVKNVTIALSLSSLAEPEITFARDGKPLKSLPPDVKKNPKVVDILDRKKSLTRAVSNTKRLLEQSMCAGNRFRGAELKSLMAHALVRPFLERLVVKTATGMGFPAKGGASLKNWSGTTTAMKANDEWTIAHPLDFVAAGEWHEWQAECLKAERLQPFKQIFREVYVRTPAEKEDGDRSRRYSGQQVNENQAKALLAGRGWSTRDDLSKIYRDANLVVMLQLDSGYTTPADAAAPAVGEVVFHRRGDWKRLALDAVPRIIFSEVMRDLDLVVSVAHVGGVDPEASQSTVEMRADLLRETCKLLKMDNVKLDSRHALIQGEYGRYSVHMGSGVVHKQPGGSLCVVPVNTQHRGRLFLPFADDDPRTAEVISKVLMLARDKEIQDPSILQQIVAR